MDMRHELACLPRRYWSVSFDFVAIIFLLPALMAPQGGPLAAAQDEYNLVQRKRPNLLLILTDDQSAFTLGLAGNQRGATPNIDRLARQGVSFNHAYCNAPVCTPSRQSLITGKLPHAVGVTRLETPLPENARTLGHWLGANGYRTAAIGKMHFNGSSRHGFETRIDNEDWLAHLEQKPPEGGNHQRPWRPFLDPPSVWLNAQCLDAGLPLESMESTYFVDQAIEYMSRESEKPFALVVSFYDPHAPFRFPREWLGRFRPREFSVPPISQKDRREQPKVFQSLTDDDFLGIQAAYYTSVSFVDHQIGRLIKSLDDQGLSSQTLVVFLSDNGYLLGQHGRVEKHCFYEPAVCVPLVVRWLGHLPSGKQIESLVELVDLFPTVCHLLGTPSPSTLHGIDLVPIIQGTPGVSAREAVFSEYLENEEAMIRTSRYKLIVGTGRRQRKDHMQPADPPSGPYQRLFDLERDPDETTDLSEDPHSAVIRSSLLSRMHQRLVETWRRPEPIPVDLSPLEVIHWCLAPRD